MKKKKVFVIAVVAIISLILFISLVKIYGVEHLMIIIKRIFRF